MHSEDGGMETVTRGNFLMGAGVLAAGRVLPMSLIELAIAKSSENFTLSATSASTRPW